MSRRSTSALVAQEEQAHDSKATLHVASRASGAACRLNRRSYSRITSSRARDLAARVCGSGTDVMPWARGSQTVVAMVTSLPALSGESGDGLFDNIEMTDEHGHTLIGISRARQRGSSELVKGPKQPRSRNWSSPRGLFRRRPKGLVLVVTPSTEGFLTANDGTLRPAAASIPLPG